MSTSWESDPEGEEKREDEEKRKNKEKKVKVQEEKDGAWFPDDIKAIIRTKQQRGRLGFSVRMPLLYKYAKC